MLVTELCTTEIFTHGASLPEMPNAAVFLVKQERQAVSLPVLRDTDIKITEPPTPVLFWILPPILDALFLLLSGGFQNKAVVSLAYDTPKGKVAFDQVRKSAEAGDAVSQFKIGREYEDGHCFEKNDAEALNWYHKTAAQNQADAQDSLGRMYFKSNNFEEAYFWYSLAAKQGKSVEEPEVLRSFLSVGQIANIEKRVSAWSPEK